MNQDQQLLDQLKNVTSEDIDAYCTTLLVYKRVSKSTINRKLASLRRFYNYLVSSGRIPSSPFAATASKRSELLALPREESFDSNLPLDQSVVLSKLKSPLLNPLTTIAAGHRDGLKLLRRFLRSKYSFIYLTILVAVFMLGQLLNRMALKNRQNASVLLQPKLTTSRVLVFNGRLMDKSGHPVSSASKVTFRLYTQPSYGRELYTTGPCSIQPDPRGRISLTIGETCGSEIASSIFSQEPQIFLGITVNNDNEMNPRQQIATSDLTRNSQLLNNHVLSASASAEQIPLLTQSGDLVLASRNPTLLSTSGTFQIRGQSLSLVSDTGSNGDITIAPDGEGKVNFLFGGKDGKQVSATAANLGPEGILYYGAVANNLPSCALLKLQSGLEDQPQQFYDTPSIETKSLSATEVYNLPPPTPINNNLKNRFDIDCLGNTAISGKLQVAGSMSLSSEYSRLGNHYSSHGLSQNADLLVSGKVEVDDDAYLDGKLYVGTAQDNKSINLNGENGQAALFLGGGAMPFGLYQDKALVSNYFAGNIGLGTTNATNILTVAPNSSTKPIADAWTTYSSGRFKENVQAISDALAKINALQPVYFTWKKDYGGKHDLGFIAEQVGSVIPEVVTREDDGVWARSIDYARLSSLAIAGIKEQQTQIENLKDKFLALNLNDYGEVVPEVQANNSTGYIYDGLLADQEGIINNQKYDVKDSDGQIVKRAVALASLVSGRIHAGLLTVQNASVHGLLLAQSVITNSLTVATSIRSSSVETTNLTASGSAQLASIETNLIRPIPDQGNVVVDLSSSDSKLGKLIVKGKQAESVATIDGLGNASISGTLTVNQLTTHDATIAGRLYADQIITKKGTIDDLLKSATTTSTIVNTTYQTIYQTASPSAYPTQETVAATTIPSQLSNLRESPSTSLGILDLASLISDKDLNLTSGLTVLGETSLGKTFIHGPLLASGVSFDEGAFNSFSSNLKIQSLASFPIDIMSGKITIDTQGNMIVSGTFTASAGVTTNLIRPIADGNVVVDLTNSLGHFIVNGRGGTAVSTIDSSGNSTLAGELTAKAITAERVSINQLSFVEASSSAIPIAASEVAQNTGIVATGIKTNSTSGESVLPKNQADVVIFTQKVSDQSLVFLTPRSPTYNKVLYVAGKKGAVCTGSIPSCTDGFIHVALDGTVDQDIRFTWWIVN